MTVQQETAIQDVEMENADNAGTAEDAETAKKDADLLTIQEIREQCRQIEKAVTSKEPRFVVTFCPWGSEN